MHGKKEYNLKHKLFFVSVQRYITKEESTTDAAIKHLNTFQPGNRVNIPPPPPPQLDRNRQFDEAIYFPALLKYISIQGSMLVRFQWTPLLIGKES